METETTLLKNIQVALSDIGSRVFRNNVGVADYDGHKVVYGLAPGSSDLIGWTPVDITPEMVGRTLAVFTAIEVKTTRGRVSEAQDKFLKRVERDGGFAVLARSETEAVQGVIGGIKKT